MQLVEVGKDKKRIQAFHELAVRLYRGNAYWIRPIEADIEKLFDPSKNNLFQEGAEAIRWLAIDATGQVIGRVAAFINPRTATKGNEQPTGGLGFFECIDNQEVAFTLFDAAREWLAARGMEAMDGPINFGERDNWWGLLVEPHNLPPSWGMFYHHPYYRAFFENYGFQDYFQQYVYWIPIEEKGCKEHISQSLINRANRIYDSPGYEFKYINPKELDKYAEDFRQIYNEAWAKNTSAGEMTPQRAKAIMQMFKPIMVPKLMWFGYYEGRPISMFIMIPDLNQLFKYVNGKLDLKGKLTFLYHKLRKKNTMARGVIFGVVPDFQGKGIESATALAFTRVGWEPDFQYKELEMNWIGDFNPKMLGVIRILGAKKYKTYITYRYLFDRSKEFSRHPVL